jgi:hypothetical protein
VRKLPVFPRSSETYANPTPSLAAFVGRRLLFAL